MKDPVMVQLVTDGSEMRKQLVLLGVSAVVMVGLVWVQRKFSGPDAFNTARMRCLAQVQEYADGRAKFWHELSGKAASAYLASRP